MLRKKGTFTIAVGIVALLCGVANAQLYCPEGILENVWDPPGPSNQWSRPENWSRGVPDQCHNVLIDLPAWDILMNVDESEHEETYTVHSFTAIAPGSLTFADLPGTNTDPRMTLIGDMVHTGRVNEYDVFMGPNNQIMVGDPHAVWGEPDPYARTEGFEWYLTGGRYGGKADVWVTGTIGPGKWTISEGNLYLGFESFDFQLPIPGALGTIDSEHVDGAGIDNSWTCSGVEMIARRCQNLDTWTFTQSDEPGSRLNNLDVTDYLQVNRLHFETDSEGSGAMGYLHVGAGPYGASGLHVKDYLTLESHSPDVNGPEVWAEKLSVYPGAELIIQDGVNCEIRALGIPDHYQLPHSAVFGHRSALKYGPRTDDQSQTRFRVGELRVTPALLRPAALRFTGDSYITTLEPPDSGQLQDMTLDLEVSLDIAAQIPTSAIDWYTGDVDLIAGPSGGSGADYVRTLEAITADSCNIWFEDLPKQRCLKYWRSLEVKAVDFALVDRHDNHRPNPGGGLHANYPEAMYVLGDVKFTNYMSVVDLNGLRMYYGGEYNTHAFEVLNGNPVPLRRTWYGDFDGDCYIDDLDFTRLAIGYGGPGVAVANPLLDATGDCDVDLEDFWGFFFPNLLRPPHPECEPGKEPVCPAWLASGELPGFGDTQEGPPDFGGDDSSDGFGGDGEAEEAGEPPLPPGDAPADPMAEFVAMAFFDHLTLETLADTDAEAEFVDLIWEVTDWLLVNLPLEQRMGLVAMLQTPDVTFETEVAAEVVPTIVLRLSE